MAITIEEVLEKLNSRGCYVSMSLGEWHPPVVPVGLVWVDGQQVCWARLPCNGMQDTHSSTYTKATNYHDQYAEFTLDDGVVLCFGPVDEWDGCEGVDLESYYRNRAAVAAFLATPDGPGEVRSFLNNSINSAPKTLPTFRR